MTRWIRGFVALGIVVLTVAWPRGAKAQEREGGWKASLGVRVGMTLSTVRFEDPNANNQTEIRTGFHMGAGASVALGSHLDLEALLLFSQGGFGGRGGHPASLRTGYLELPLVVSVRAPWQVSPHLSLGIAPRVLVHCALGQVGVVGNAGCDDPVVGAGWGRFDLASLVGMGLSFGMGGGSVVLDGMVGWGLLDVKSDPLPPGWARSADVRVSTAYRLPLGERK